MASEPDARPFEPENRKPRKSRIGWILFFVALAVFVFSVGWIVSQFFSTPLRVSRETTYIVEPLKPDGKQVDYFAAIERGTYPPNLASEDNGYRLIVERLGSSPEAEPWHFEQVCAKLGLDPSGIRHDLSYEETDAFLAAYVKSPEYGDADKAIVARLRARDRSEAREEDPSADDEPRADDTLVVDSVGHRVQEPDASVVLEQRLGAPWTFRDLPMMERWLADNSPALNLLGEAVRKPVFHIPLARKSEQDLLMVMTLPDIQQMRSFTRGLSARAYYRIGTGDLDGAIEDIITCKRLGRHLGHGAMLIDLLVGIAIEGVADTIGVAGSLEYPPTKEQLRRLLAELDDLPPRSDFKEKMRFERFLALDALQSLAHGGGQEWTNDAFLLPVVVSRIIHAVGLDWNLVASRLNRHCDSLIDHGIDPSPPEFRPAQLISRAARSALVGDMLASLVLPGVDAGAEMHRRTECEENMQRVTLAMLLYERDHGTLPPACTVDRDGAPLHSWRVLLLPYLGHETLYNQIRLDEPWDSAHNSALHETDVPFYQCPTAALRPGRTAYCVVVGDKAAFDETGRGRRLDALGPLSANMILLVERKTDACWMDPGGNVTYDDARRGIDVLARGIGSGHRTLAAFGLRSGAVLVLSKHVSERELLGLIEGTTDKRP